MAEPALTLVDDWRTLDADATALFARDGRADGTLGWFAALSETTLAAGERLRIAVLSVDRHAVACLPLVAQPARPGSGLRGLSAPYTCRFSAPLGTPAHARHLGRALGALATDTLRLDALDEDDPAALALLDGLAAEGWAVRPHLHFTNRYAEIPDWAGYWRALPPALRSTIERKRRKLERAHGLTIEISGDAVGLADYLAVYADSWKPPEPHADFMPALVRAAARDGTLRLGIARIDGTAAAAQIWLVAGPRATIFKLAHRQTYDHTSIGSILTAAMLLAAIETDGATTVDFGRGDQAFKALWLPAERRRIGVTAANPRRPFGLLHAARDVWAPRLAGALRRRATG